MRNYLLEQNGMRTVFILQEISSQITKMYLRFYTYIIILRLQIINNSPCASLFRYQSYCSCFCCCPTHLLFYTIQLIYFL